MKLKLIGLGMMLSVLLGAADKSGLGVNVPMFKQSERESLQKKISALEAENAKQAFLMQRLKQQMEAQKEEDKAAARARSRREADTNRTK